MCKKTLEKIEELGNAAKDGILNGKSNVVNDRDKMADTEQDDDKNNNSGSLNDVPNVDEQYIKEAITSNRPINSSKRSVPFGTNSLSHTEDECNTANHQSTPLGIVDTNNQALDNNPYISCSDCSLSATNNQQMDGITVLKKTYPGVIEWILPSNISRSQVFDAFHGSNACNIISVLGAMKLASSMIFPTDSNELSATITNFIRSMKEENALTLS